MAAESKMIRELITILELLDNFVGNYPIFLYLIDRDFNLIWTNRFVRQQFPDLEKNSDKKCCEALWGRKSLCQDCPLIQESDQRQILRNIHHRLLPKDNEEVYLQVITLPLRNNNMELEGILKIGLDVTSIEKEQHALREKEKLFASVIDTSADAIFTLDTHDKISSWNKGAEDIFGYTAGEIIGRPVILLIPHELIELGEIYYLNRELENHSFIRKYETQRIDKYGRLIYVDLTRTIIHDNQGRNIGSSVILKDITSRKELEFELRRTILELSKLNELDEIIYTTHLLDDILQIILIAITAGEGLRFNRAFLLLIDDENQTLNGHLAIGPANEFEAHRIWSTLQDHYRSLKEVVKIFQIDLQGSDSRLNEIIKQVRVPLGETENILIKAIKNRKTFQVKQGRIEDPGNINFAVQDKSLFEILESDTFVVVPLIAKTQPIGIIIADNKITGRDITEEEIESLKIFAIQASMAIENARLYNNLEDRINELQIAYKRLEENSQKLVKAERLAAIGEMSAKVAHEIRNPLVSIGGMARLVEKRLAVDSPLRQYTTLIKDQISNLESILNNILGIANPRKPRRRDTDIHAILEQVLVMMDSVIQKRKLRINKQFECNDSTVLGDEKLLYQVFLNLIKNAIESMNKGGLLTLMSACEERFVWIHVQDSGSGIPEQYLEQVYDPFFTTKMDGTGLGLAIVRQIVKDHKGQMKIESKTGEGTIVRIGIPRAGRNFSRKIRETAYQH